MRLPNDQAGRLRCYRRVLRNEASRLVARDPDYVIFKRRAHEWLRNERIEYTLREVCRLLHEYVESGGTINEQVETRPEYAHFEFHYDLRIPMDGRPTYFETVLDFEDADDEDDLTIVVVNVHDA